MGIFKRFKNPHIKHIKRSPIHFLGWFLGFYREKRKEVVPKDFTYPFPKKKEFVDSSALFVNHCTYYVRVLDCYFLTDPIWSDRCSPFSFIGPKRYTKPNVLLSDIKRLDYVLISHNHYDHLDLPSIRDIIAKFPDVKFIVPMGLKKWFAKRKIDNVTELSWWQTIRFRKNKNKPEVAISATPAQHHSGRYIFDSNKSLWAGFVVTVKNQVKEKRFYFTGDTGYNPYDFKQIGVIFPNIDLSICPIGTYMPRAFMQSVHIGPKEAVSIHVDIKAKKSVGMHWGTFCLSEEPLNAPPYDLYCEMKKRNIVYSSFLPIAPGELINW